MSSSGDEPLAMSGGCQCGAVRFRVTSFGRSSVCHCRMCQKATGGLFAALFGFGGALISLFLSKWMAKQSMGVQLIENPADPTERWLVSHSASKW